MLLLHGIFSSTAALLAASYVTLVAEDYFRVKSEEGPDVNFHINSYLKG